MRHHLSLPASALGLAALLLLPAGFPGAVAENDEITIEVDGDIAIDPVESDGIGLNAADTANYDLIQEGTANAAHYVSDFDKSFWVNTVTGGTAPTDVQAVLSGMTLKAGGTYRLTFSCTGAESEFPVVIRSGDMAVFESVASAAADGADFDETFTIEQASSDAVPAFLLGGKDCYSVTLRDISLVRIQ